MKSKIEKGALKSQTKTELRQYVPEIRNRIHWTLSFNKRKKQSIIAYSLNFLRQLANLNNAAIHIQGHPKQLSTVRDGPEDEKKLNLN